ncbi:Vacuolar protein sorting-associated protein 51 [Thoreauomyces humboldtii]|nr:Vacuolar protein sorting-associated protein 51 [Thoreauomyces humboldtii]
MPVTTPTAQGSPQSQRSVGDGPQAGAIEEDPNSRAAARQRKRRDMLKSYYGMSGDAAAPAVAAKPKDDPLNIDNQAFNADLHLNKLLNEMALPDLIQRDNELVTEIKQLDGDMKTLVYENYNKFISATDTIRRMKVNIDDMESEMEMLNASMTKINDSSAKIDGDLAAERARLHQLTGVDNLLKKLHFVFELPTRLRQCVDRQQYGQAVRHYARVAGLLDRYKHLAAFRTITDECSAIVDGVSRLVKNKLHNPTSSLAEIAESVGLLLKLNAAAPVDLAREHLQAASAQLGKVRERCLVHMNGIKTPRDESVSELSEEPLPADVRLAMEKITYLDQNFVREFSGFVEAFSAFFLKPTEPVTSPETSMKMGIPDARVNVYARLSPEHQVSIRAELVVLVDALTKQYIEEVDLLLHIPEDITKLSPLAYIHVLDRMHKDVQEMEPLRRIGRMDKRVNAMSFELLSKVVTAVFAKIKQEFFDRYARVTAEESDLNRFVKELNTWMKNTLINQYLPILERFVSPDIDFMRHSVFGTDDILDQIQRGLDVFWLSFTEDMVAHNDPKGATRPPALPVVTLMMSRSALDLSLGTVEGVMSAYTDVLFSRKGDAIQPQPVATARSRPHLQVVTASGGTGRGPQPTHVSGTSDETMHRARDISGICKVTGQKLLTAYVDRLATELTEAVQVHLDTHDWQHGRTDEPTAVCTTWVHVLDAMHKVETDVGQLYPDDRAAGARAPAMRTKPGVAGIGGGGHSRAGSSSQQPTSSSGSSFRGGAPANAAAKGGKFDPLWSNIDKLFAERVDYYGLVEMTARAPLTAATKIILKCLMEETRLLSFGSTGFKQMHLDVEFLKVHLWSFCGDERLFNSLVDEVQTCAFRRCEDPKPLDFGIVNEIVSAYEPGASRRR